MTQAQNVAELSSDINSSGVLQPVGGGTGLTSFTAGTNYVAPGGALGTPSSGTLTNCTFPTLNQNTTGTAAGLSATLAVGSGGTGTTTLTANNVLLGNGTSALQVVAPGTSGNILTSNGTTWASTAPAGGGVTSLNGQTGAITNTTFGNIGSYTSGYIASTAGRSAGTTVSGSGICFTSGGSSFSSAVSDQGGFSGYGLTGTWRQMNYNPAGFAGDGFFTSTAALFVRVS